MTAQGRRDLTQEIGVLLDDFAVVIQDADQALDESESLCLAVHAWIRCLYKITHRGDHLEDPECCWRGDVGVVDATRRRVHGRHDEMIVRTTLRSSRLFTVIRGCSRPCLPNLRRMNVMCQRNDYPQRRELAALWRCECAKERQREKQRRRQACVYLRRVCRACSTPSITFCLVR